MEVSGSGPSAWQLLPALGPAKAGAQHPAGGSRPERGRPARAALPGLGRKGLTGWGRREQQSFG